MRRRKRTLKNGVDLFGQLDSGAAHLSRHVLELWQAVEHEQHGFLVIDMQGLKLSPMPIRKQTIQFIYPEVARPRGTWWLLVAPHAEVDLCSIDPGYDVDLCIFSDLKSMTAIWMGLETVNRAVRDRRVRFSGDRKLAATMQSWLGLSPFAKERKLAA
jgi:hypothetical protein